MPSWRWSTGSYRGDTVVVRTEGGRLVDVDSCVAPLVVLLNQHGFPTRASCCGHGFRPGLISLRDGRELVIAKDFEEARKIDRMFPLDIHGHVYAIYETETGEERDVAYAITECYAMKSDWRLRLRQARAAIQVLLMRGWRRPGIVEPKEPPMADETPLDLRGQLIAGKMTVNEARKRQNFRDGDLHGRWPSDELANFFSYSLRYRNDEFEKAKRKMLESGAMLEDRTMRPGQIETNAEYLAQRFAYIDRMLEQLYVDHFTSAYDVAAVDVDATIRYAKDKGFTTMAKARRQEARHAPGCEVAEKLSDSCTCSVEHDDDCPILHNGASCTCGAWEPKRTT